MGLNDSISKYVRKRNKIIGNKREENTIIEKYIPSFLGDYGRKEGYHFETGILIWRNDFSVLNNQELL